MTTAVAIGRAAEVAARHFLETTGLCLLESNYHAPCGEIDLIMRDLAVLVFVEVRLRRSDRFGSAIESVNARKKTRILATAAHYLQRHQEVAYQPCRFDVVAFTGTIDHHPPNWIKNAFML